MSVIFYSPIRALNSIFALQTGYQSEMAYAKSLSRFSAKLGPEGWKHAAQRLQRVLAPSVPFGLGWIGEHEAPPGTIFKRYSSGVNVANPTRIDQNIASTSLRRLPGVSSTSHPPVPTASFAPTPSTSRSLTVIPVAQTAINSLLTAVTNAILTSGAGSGALFLEKSTMVGSLSYVFQ